MVTLALFLFQKVIQTISRRNSGRELFEALECLENHASNKRSVFLFVCFVFVFKADIQTVDTEHRKVFSGYFFIPDVAVKALRRCT